MVETLRLCPRGHELVPGNLKEGKRLDERYTLECLTCKRVAEERVRRAKGQKRRDMTRCGRGHDLTQLGSRHANGNCRQCALDREEARRRARGVQPRSEPAERCHCGHDLTIPANRRPGRTDCAVCHREKQAKRYHADVERHRAAARQYASANRDAARERLRVWREANRDTDRARARASQLARRLGRDAIAVTYAAILARDPCVYCDASGKQIDHIVPIAGGGTNDWTNLTAACSFCNQSKKDRPLLAWMAQR